MTEKDYKLIASCIRSEYSRADIIGREAIRGVIIGLSAALLVEDSSFSIEGFYTACGLPISA